MVTIQLEPAEERQLREVASARGQDVADLARRAVKEYLRCVSAASAGPDGMRLTKAEAQLLQEINQGLPAATWQRYHELVGRRRDGTLTEPEYDELTRLTDEVELAHARRMEKLADLARLRHVSLDQIMAELGLRDPGYV